MKSKLLGSAVAGTLAMAFGMNAYAEPTDEASSRITRTTAVEKSKITAEQRARLAAKLAHVNAIIAAAERDGAALTAEKRTWMKETLYSMPVAQVQSIAPTSSVQLTSEAIASARKVTPKLLGDISTDLVYRPFAPCRYIDTRNVGGKINGIVVYSTQSAGSVYGGSAACSPTTLAGVGNDDDIAALTLNMTIVDTSTAASPGFATMRPAGSTNLTALVNWTVSSPGFQLGNAAVITQAQNGAFGNAEELEILTSGPVHAIVDIAGAFVAPAATPLACVTQSVSQSVPAGGFDVLTATCPAGYTMTGGGYDGFSTGANSSTNPENAPTANGWFASFYNNAPGAFTMQVFARCCRVPGL
jgi:hypothetical protein